MLCELLDFSFFFLVWVLAPPAKHMMQRGLLVRGMCALFLFFSSFPLIFEAHPARRSRQANAGASFNGEIAYYAGFSRAYLLLVAF